MKLDPIPTPDEMKDERYFQRQMEKSIEEMGMDLVENFNFNLIQ